MRRSNSGVPGATQRQTRVRTEEEEQTNFFGIPLGEPEPEEKLRDLSAHAFKIAGVLKTELKEGPGQGGLRGLMPRAGIYVPLPAARDVDPGASNADGRGRVGASAPEWRPR